MKKLFPVGSMSNAKVAVWLLVAATFCQAGIAQQCDTLVLCEMVITNAAARKVGFEECAIGSPPRVFLTKVSTFVANRDFAHTNSEKTFTYTTSAGYNYTNWESFDLTTAHPSDSTQPCAAWVVDPPTLTSGGIAWKSGDDYSGNCSTTRETDGGWVDEGCKTDVDKVLLETGVTATQTVCTSEVRIDEVHVDYSVTIPNYGTDHTVHNEVQTTSRSNEYTDGLLWTNILGRMVGYPTNWTQSNGCASASITSDHLCGTLQKMKYRFKIPASETNRNYYIGYDLVRAGPNGAEVVDRLKAKIVGTGDPIVPAYSEERELQPPQWDPAPQESFVSVSIANVKIESITDNDSGITAGDWPQPGCRSCGGTAARNTGDESSGAAYFTLSLGYTWSGARAGELDAWTAVPSEKLFSPAGLRVLACPPEVELISVDDQLRQVNAPQALADIVTITPGVKYDIRFYLPSQVGSKSGSTYTVSGDPYVTWTLENPDSSGVSSNRLNITERRGSTSRFYGFEYNSQSRTWTFTSPGNLAQRLTSTTVDAVAQTRQVVTTVKSSGGLTAAKTSRKYRTFWWGEGVVEETLSPDADPQVTTLDYYDSAVPFTPSGNLLPLRQVVHPDGSWEYYTYDSMGRKTAVYSGFMNEAAPAPGLSPNANACRVVTLGYGAGCTLGSGDDGNADPYAPRLTVETVLGVETARRYLVVLPGERRDIVCTTPSAAWNDAANLVTITRFYTNGAAVNSVKSVQRPEGTMEIYEYGFAANGGRTNIVSTGQPDAGGTTIIDGTRVETVRGPLGELVSRSAVDIASGALLSLELYSDYDSFSRPRRVSFLDGTHEDVQYACCGVDTRTDRDGVVTQYWYDQAKRELGSTRLGITTTNLLDAAGNVLQTVRVGTDGSLVVLNQAAYDAAGRVTRQTNALGGVTTYAEASSQGQRVRTTTHPDGGTRVETYFLDGTLARVEGTAVPGVRCEYGADTTGRFAREIKLQAGGSDTAEWSKEYSDLAGRPCKTLYADNTASERFYNAKGLLWKEVDPDNTIKLYKYNARGEPEYTIQALSAIARGVATPAQLDSNWTAIKASSDRITRTVAFVGPAAADAGLNARRTETYVWPILNQDSAQLVSATEVSADGLRSWSFGPAGTNQARTAYAANSYRYVTNTAADGSTDVAELQNGRLVSRARRDAAGAQIARTTFGYDSHGRVTTETDARNGTRRLLYNGADLVTASTTPAPGSGEAPQTTATYYDPMLRVTNVVAADGGSVFTSYYPSGSVKQMWGARVYPVAYSYDYAGRLKTMTNWSAFPSAGARVTTWDYSALRGWLSGKRYDGSTPGPLYTNTAAGRLDSRTWARGLRTTYSYTPAGDLAAVAYNDGTTALAFGYDRRGRQTSVTNGASICVLSYNDASQTLGESWIAGPMAGLAVTNRYDQLLRRTNTAALNASTVLASAGCGYDPASRLQSVASGQAGVTYTYLANSALAGQIQGKWNSATRMTTTKSYDYLDRLQGITSAPAADTGMSFNYSHNFANQRVRTALADGSYWRFEYDELGQVVSGKKYWADGTPVAGQQFEYGFDDIGNRASAKAGGDQNGSGLREATYTANSLNQYTSRTVPGAVDILGVGFATNAVTVNGQTTYRKGEYFRAQLPVDNSSPRWTNITVAAAGQTNVSGNLFVAQTPEAFGYDLDGNLTNDGRWAYTWDGENRLVRMVARTAVGPQQRLDFGYDWQGRRISKRVWNNTAGTGTPVADLKFLYDGWNLVAELNATNNAVVRSYVWGSDLSGSLQGAGGVGGLLAIYDASTINNQPSTHFVVYDGNGNVMGLVNAADGKLSAQYEYGPFGELIRATGPVAKVNPFRFSTKYQDDESDLLYYGYRFYSASMGRWLSRDPIEEKGGPNLFGFVGNDPSNRVDPLGQDYYIASVDGITCIRHRVMIGDDGLGGYYWIELYPDTKNVGTLKECQRRICGKGIINYLHAKGSAKDKFDDLKKDKDARAKLVKHVKTTKNQDQALAAGAAAYGAKETTTYCFILNDCWSIEGHVRETCAQQALCKKLNDFLTKELFKLAYPNH